MLKFDWSIYRQIPCFQILHIIFYFESNMSNFNPIQIAVALKNWPQMQPQFCVMIYTFLSRFWSYSRSARFCQAASNAGLLVPTCRGYPIFCRQVNGTTMSVGIFENVCPRLASNPNRRWPVQFKVNGGWKGYLLGRTKPIITIVPQKRVDLDMSMQYLVDSPNPASPSPQTSPRPSPPPSPVYNPPGPASTSDESMKSFVSVVFHASGIAHYRSISIWANGRSHDQQWPEHTLAFLRNCALHVSNEDQFEKVVNRANRMAGVKGELDTSVFVANLVYVRAHNRSPSLPCTFFGGKCSKHISVPKPLNLYRGRPQPARRSRTMQVPEPSKLQSSLFRSTTDITTPCRKIRRLN